MNSFSELNLIAPIQRAIADENYTVPTPIQARTIPHVLDGRDILGCAQTGTGKTAAFALPILNRLESNPARTAPNCPRVLVLAPTRELAVQIGNSFSTYGRHLQLRIALVYGGVSQVHQVRALNRGVHVLVATPGRLLDLMGQGHIDLRRLEVFVLDEADRMLDMGFLPDLRRIIGSLPPQRQSLFFSATLPQPIIDLSQQLLTDPVNVQVAAKTNHAELIEQRVMLVEQNQKRTLLKTLLAGPNVGQTVVFTRTKRRADIVAEYLQRDGTRATAIHGNKSQNARQRALDEFRREKVRVLVATDVAARGIDIDGISHVVNFDLPNEAENYVHRIGRTGRAGASGIAISFCSSDERHELREIERLIGKKIVVDAMSDATTANTSNERSDSCKESPLETAGNRPHNQRRATDSKAHDTSRRRRPRRNRRRVRRRESVAAR